MYHTQQHGLIWHEGVLYTQCGLHFIRVHKLGTQELCAQTDLLRILWFETSPGYVKYYYFPWYFVKWKRYFYWIRYIVNIENFVIFLFHSSLSIYHKIILWNTLISSLFVKHIIKALVSKKSKILKSLQTYFCVTANMRS